MSDREKCEATIGTRDIVRAEMRGHVGAPIEITMSLNCFRPYLAIYVGINMANPGGYTVSPFSGYPPPLLLRQIC
jgi:hypothetical protein